jgi:hypothetical protein
MVLTPLATPAPLSGGTIAELTSFAAGPTTVAAAATITGGTATSALFQATLP